MKKNITIFTLLSFLLTIFISQSHAQVQNTWAKKGDFGGMRRTGAVSFTIGTKGYLGTGAGSVDSLGTKDFWEYDQATDVWTQMADFGGTARTFAVGFSIGLKGYLGTGLDGYDSIVGSSTQDFWEFDPSANTWTQKADFGGLDRYGAVGFSIGSKGYVGTGNSVIEDHRNDFWEYDPAMDTWTQKANFAGLGRTFATAFSIGNKGYIGTGKTGTTVTNDFYEYDPATDVWTAKASFGGISRYGAFGASDGTYGYMGTGRILDKTNLNDFWLYDPSSDTWVQKANFTGNSRASATGFNIGDKIYLGTGDNGLMYMNDFWEYTTSSLCIPPAITSEPVNQSINYGDPAVFTVVVSDAVSYQWQVDAGTGFVNIPDTGIYSNATTSTLNISLPVVAMSGYKYRCIITGNASGGCLPVIATNGYTLTVAAKLIVITPDAGQTKTYGSADPSAYTFTFAPSLLGTDMITGQMSRTAGENAGNWVFTLGTLDAGPNYSLSVSATPAFSITAIALSVTADNKEKCDDGTIYSDGFTVTYSGFVNAEDQSVLGGALVFGGDAVTAAAAGSFSIEPSGLTSSNYTIGYTNGTLVIKPTPLAPVVSKSFDTLISSAATGNQWYKDGIEITGSTDQILMITANGDYYTIVTDNGCSSLASNSISVLDVSIKEAGTASFDIYPNPSKGEFSIKLKTAGTEKYNIEVFNNIGVLVWKQNNTSFNASSIAKLALNSPTAGLYTVILRNKTNSFARKISITK